MAVSGFRDRSGSRAVTVADAAPARATTIVRPCCCALRERVAPRARRWLERVERRQRCRALHGRRAAFLRKDVLGPQMKDAT